MDDMKYNLKKLQMVNTISLLFSPNQQGNPSEKIPNVYQQVSTL